MRLLLVDDDWGMLELIRATFDEVDAEVTAVGSIGAAWDALANERPDAIVTDVVLHSESGLDFCCELKSHPETAGIPVVLLTGSIELTPQRAAEVGADAYLPKPFSPLQLVAVVERLATEAGSAPLVGVAPGEANYAQMMMYAHDLSRAVERERTHRRMLQEAYRATVNALAETLAAKDTGTRSHSQRVPMYAMELMRAIEPALGEDASLEYGFVLHDIGKIGVSDSILQKPGPLDPDEREAMEQHPLFGYDMLRGIAFLAGEGLSVVRSHHERWDGRGYPDHLVGDEIPLGARIFAVADTLDAMISERPYRKPRTWPEARAEILEQSGTQFDPHVVDAFRECESQMRDVQRSLVAV